MAGFDREKFKSRHQEAKKKARKIDRQVEKRELYIDNGEIPDDEIKVITVSSIKDQIVKFFEKGFVRGKLIGSSIDPYISWDLGQLVICTGIPSHGKSEFMDFLYTRLNILHGWKVMFYSPENYPIPIHFYKLAKKIHGKPIKMDDPAYPELEDYIDDNYFWIYYEKNTIETILKTAKKQMDEAGVKILSLDPYNMVDTSMMSNETETLYINRFLDMLSKFARRENILLFLIAHPTKIGKEKDTRRHLVPTMYSISGSAHFYNKADYGVVVHRQEDPELGGFLEHSEVHIQKVRFNHLGEPGTVVYGYNKRNGRYSEVIDELTCRDDDSDWMELVREEE